MARIDCSKLTNLDCPVVFEGEEVFVIGQMVAHGKGSHALNISETDIRKIWGVANPEAPVIEKPVVEKVKSVSLPKKPKRHFKSFISELAAGRKKKRS